MEIKIKNFALPLIAIVLLVLAILWLAGTFQSKIAPDEIIAASSNNSERAIVLVVTQAEAYEDVPATVRSKQSANVAARIMAPIKAIHVKAGDMVKKGDVLIELDSRNLQASSAQSRDNVRAIYAQMRQAKAQADRTKNLFRKGSATQVDMEKATANYANLQALHSSAKQQLNAAETNLSYSQIRAEFSARVIDRYAEPGDLATPGMKLLTLYNPKVLRLEANIRESLALSLSIGQNLSAHVPALNNNLTVQVEEIVPAADPGARSFLIKAKVDYLTRLLPGMYARIRIPAGVEELLLVPLSYIKQLGQLDVVWVLEDNIAVRRFIRIGQVHADQVVVVSGLTAGEKLIMPVK